MKLFRSRNEKQTGERNLFGGHLVGTTYYPTENPYALIDKYRHWVYVSAKKNAEAATSSTLRLYTQKPNGKKSRFKTVTADKRHFTKDCKLSYKAARLVNTHVEIEEVLQHPLLDLLEKVNWGQNAADLMTYTYTSLELVGNAYWYIVKDKFDIPIEIYPLFPQNIKIIPGPNRTVHTYEYVYGGETIRYSGEEVIHFKYYNPKDYFYGQGKLQACITAADQYTAASVLNTGTLENGGVMDYALMLPADEGMPNREKVSRLKAFWKKMYGGRKNGGLGVLWGGADLKQISLSPRELNYLQSQKFNRDEIAAVFGVPQSKLTSESVNRANAESGEYSYLKDTILPMIRLVEQKINEQLCPMFDETLFFVYDNPVPEEKEFRLKERSQNIQVGYSTVNEERLADGKEAIDGGDELRGRQSILNYWDEDKTVPEPKKKALQPLREPSARYSKKYAEDVVKYFADLEKSIIKNIDKSFIGKRKDLLPTDIYSWFAVDTWNTYFKDISRPFVTVTLIKGANDALKQINAGTRLQTTSGRIVTATEKRLGLIVSVNTTTIKKLRTEIAQAIEAGNGTKAEVKRIVTKYIGAEAARHRAENIARTETIWCYNEGAVEGYKESGVVQAKEWLVAEDDRLCEFCSLMQGKMASLTSSFFAKGTAIDGKEGGVLVVDYEDIEHPPLHPQCRCKIVPVLNEEYR